MHGLMPNPLTKLSESAEEDEVLRSRKRKLDMEAESDGEQAAGTASSAVWRTSGF